MKSRYKIPHYLILSAPPHDFLSIRSTLHTHTLISLTILRNSFKLMFNLLLVRIHMQSQQNELPDGLYNVLWQIYVFQFIIHHSSLHTTLHIKGAEIP
jgi:hypothetical protein